MKRNNKTWIQQLSESYIRQTLNEMAVTPAGMEQQKKIQAASGEMYRKQDDGYISGSIELIAARHREYHGLLQTHPTKIFDGTGQHVGNITHQALPGQEATEMGGASAEAVAEHEKKIGKVANLLNYRINAHNDEVTKRGQEEHLIPPDHRPHPDHLSLGGGGEHPWYTALDHTAR